MRSVCRVLCGIAAACISFWIVVRLSEPVEIHSNTLSASTATHDAPRSSQATSPGVAGSGSAPRPVPGDKAAINRSVVGDPPSSSDGIELSELRNGILNATGRDMQARQASVPDCLLGVELAGALKFRLAVHVVSSAKEARFDRWRFVEIVDGQELPGSFPGCVETALGGGGLVSPRPGTTFPVYDGDISTVYRIQAPND
jgi:hypothetical protein